MGKKKHRKVKIVPVREPSGRPSRAGEEREFAPAAVKRLAHAAVHQMELQRWGTELGRLFLAHKITIGMLVAGERWRDMAARYHQAIDAPPSSPQPCNLERGSKGSPPDPDSADGRARTATDRKGVKDMREAHAVLMGAGKLSERMVRAVCERDEICPGYELANLVRGLGWLEQNWQLTGDPRIGR